MCLFTYRNTASNTALVKGVEKFECGSCPECLQKKSRKWALRCGMEAKVSPGVMVTLTYDSYKIVNGKETSEENPVDTSISVNKKHCQDFLKRLRKHFPDKKIKYLLTAEYGKRTGRAHYHALLFNVVFDDLIKYKKSKRNNIIYKSKTLEKIWKHGICTVDCINLTAKTARYCTKYCAKDAGVDDTFMLFSRGIGDEKLLELFNGKSYWIDGREYSIPREIWQKYVEKKYNIPGYSRYIGLRHLVDTEKKIYNSLQRLEKRYKDDVFTSSYYADRLTKIELQRLDNTAISYHRQKQKREIYQHYRDNDPLYQRYLAYWKRKNEVNEFNRPDELSRIHALPDKKYWSYKQKSILAKQRQRKKRDFIPPRSNCHGFERIKDKKVHEEKSFAPLSRHYTANDTKCNISCENWKELTRLRLAFSMQNPSPALVSPF